LGGESKKDDQMWKTLADATKYIKQYQLTMKDEESYKNSKELLHQMLLNKQLLKVA
tara:strand:+ start:287 stop:454 length:168 start_codon:yes stop_codon:yes gene_type:complete